MELKSSLIHSKFTDNSRPLCFSGLSSDINHCGNEFRQTPTSQLLKNSNLNKNNNYKNRTDIETLLNKEDFHHEGFQAQDLCPNLNRTETISDRDQPLKTENVSNLSAYIPDEYVYYEYGEDYGSREKSTTKSSSEENIDGDEPLAIFEEVNELNKDHCLSSEEKSPITDISLPNNISGSLALFYSNQDPTNTSSVRSSPTAEDFKITDSTSFESPSVASLDPSEEVVIENHTSHPNKVRLVFKKLTPTEVIEQYLSNPEILSYDELYYRTAKVASLMVELQDEARILDKEINDFEAARKSDQQIVVEEARLEKEQMQKEDDAIFEVLLKKYGSFARSSIDDWTMFHENFYQNHLEENPEHYRILLLLRNPQFINDFHKRTVAREKAKLKASTIKLANTIDSPPSRTEQKCMEESDRKKRKPAIDPLVFDDRKMADVYGLTHKLGDAFIGNQPLKDRYESSRELNSLRGTDENTRPKRFRGRRGNNDTDHSDHTPGVSDTDEFVFPKRTRSTRIIGDSAVSSRATTRTAPSSRESTPGAGPKIFASGKRVGRPPGSKTQVKLPSKLKSVQAAGVVKDGFTLS
ncbi:hypothetical protein GcM1_241156 [Golovinomyces cichoracearum]|uniref:Uncharacterized protein n=1 Tax=Golovinomyces cichoracearum TaxID=62708 RepID=A0A420II21_9PEZI|nr:hypothetical protein GcM1_241156 [Golovinomyces cichoracearum]